MTHSVMVFPAPDGVPGVVRYRAVDEAGAPIPGPCIVVMAVMHGNEPVGIGVIERLSHRVHEALTAGEVLTVRANLRASAGNQRHTTDGTDMNRLWDPSTLARLRRSPPESLCYEELRAIELAPLLLQADAVLDLHSTSRPSAPFLVMRDDQRHAQIARRLGVAHLVTGLHENAILSGGVGSNVGLAPGQRSERVGFTFEAGQHTAAGNAECAWLVAWRFLCEMGVWGEAPPDSDVVPEIFEVTDRVIQTQGEPWRFVGYMDGEEGGGRRGPLRQLHSFEPVQADEVVLRRGDHGVARAQFPFTMLMPSPKTPPGTDLYYITQPRHGGLTLGTVRTDDEARTEGLAIERMLDLLADDDFVTGTSWAAFDSRRLFDLCASVVGRNLRLPVGDPHRKLLVMGRGDAPTDDASHRRDTVRYRKAMQLAMLEGIPVERIQLMRGASLAWIDALTSTAMAELLSRRRERVGSDNGVKMRVSLRHPHTASMLVAGDLDLALATGDTRHVRVAFLVEAATVEPDGAGVRVRVIRTGLVSSRREVLVAAKRLTDSLRAEHAYDVAHGALRNAQVVHDLLTPDGALRSVADPAALSALRGALYRVQLGLWCDQMRLELREPVTLPTDEDLGKWLARTMAATGILDPDGLHALAVRRKGAGWLADPELVTALETRLQSSDSADALPSVLFGSKPDKTPRQPLMARDLTADDLERWVGWKRFVRGVRSVPDTRGKDFELVFSGTDIRNRFIRWYREAGELSRDASGEVLVVLAGDGLNPLRDVSASAASSDVVDAHRALMNDPNIHYLRIQHAQGTHLAWMKDFVESLKLRPSPSRPVALQWEVEHGDTVSVVLIAVREKATSLDEPWSLEGWTIQRCAVVVSDLESTGEDHEIGLFTEATVDAPETNQELIAFGRAHCGGLLTQAGARVASETGALDQSLVEACVVDQIARWIERVRVWSRTSGTAPTDLHERADWVAHRLGIKDLQLARSLAEHMHSQVDAREAAEALWRQVPAWPGRGA